MRINRQAEARIPPLLIYLALPLMPPLLPLSLAPLLLLPLAMTLTLAPLLPLALARTQSSSLLSEPQVGEYTFPVHALRIFSDEVTP